MSSSKLLTCPNCGEGLEKRWQYCPICGLDLAEADAAPRHRTEYKTEAGRLAEYTELFGSAQETLEAPDGDLEGALSECEAALELSPNSAEAHNLRGLILDLLERPDEAIQAYREAVRLDPNFEDARANLADSQQEQRETPIQMVGLDVSDPENEGEKKFASTIIAAMIMLLTLAIAAALMNGR
ncbi:MAG: tetratricopeptide repeat protein [Chloroflexi bacterium]|nr:tetratricopeptide repeat protein [Chloroflexota bacterium]